MSVIICDIDNCISDDGWRIPRIDWTKQGDERYHDYHLLAGFDKAPFNDRTHGIMSPKFKVFFLTARPLSYRALTEHWLLNTAKVPPGFELLMRPNGFRGSSPQVKQTQLDHMLDPNIYGVKIKDIVGAYDDHQGVIDMYERNGIYTAKRVAIHSVNAFHNPLTNQPAH